MIDECDEFDDDPSWDLEYSWIMGVVTPLVFSSYLPVEIQGSTTSFGVWDGWFPARRTSRWTPASGCFCFWRRFFFAMIPMVLVKLWNYRWKGIFVFKLLSYVYRCLMYFILATIYSEYLNDRYLSYWILYKLLGRFMMFDHVWPLWLKPAYTDGGVIPFECGGRPKATSNYCAAFGDNLIAKAFIHVYWFLMICDDFRDYVSIGFGFLLRGRGQVYQKTKITQSNQPFYYLGCFTLLQLQHRNIETL